MGTGQVSGRDGNWGTARGPARTWCSPGARPPSSSPPRSAPSGRGVANPTLVGARKSLASGRRARGSRICRVIGHRRLGAQLILAAWPSASGGHSRASSASVAPRLSLCLSAQTQARRFLPLAASVAASSGEPGRVPAGSGLAATFGAGRRRSWLARSERALPASAAPPAGGAQASPTMGHHTGPWLNPAGDPAPGERGLSNRRRRHE